MNELSNECIDCGWAEFNWGSLIKSANKLTQLIHKELNEPTINDLKKNEEEANA
jgi:hypothetical protein